MKYNVIWIGVLDAPLILGDFGLELQIFLIMDDDVNDQHINVSFIISMAYNQAKAQNMLLIMFDPYFQNMKIKQDYVGNFVAIQIVVDYDTRIMHPLLLQAYTI